MSIGASITGEAPTRFTHADENHHDRSYAPSFFDGDFLNETQETLIDQVADVRGKLEPADHFKLYEAAYFARGPILEIGRLAGKSTICLAFGARDGSRQAVYSIEYENKYLQLACDNLARFDLLDQVTLIQGDSVVQARRVPAPIDTLFIDGNHSYRGVKQDIESLQGRVAAGGVVMFHDFYHKANETGEFGVRRAVLEAADLGFRGRFGGIALFEQLDPAGCEQK